MWRGSRHSNKRATTRVTAAKKVNTRAKLSRSKIAQRRSKIRALQVAAGVVLMVSLIGAVSWLSFIDILAVQTIVVQGNEGVRTRAVQSQMMLATAGASLGLFSRQNTMLYPSSELENILAFEFPKIETVSIERKPTQQRVLVSIAERVPYGLWCRGNECFHIDDEGFVFERVVATSTSLIAFSGGVDESRHNLLRAWVAPNHFVHATEFIQELMSLELSVKSFAFEGEDARITFADGWELRVALDKDLGAAAFNLAAVLDEYELRDRLPDLAYIDMRFDERVYYKLRGEADNQE